MRWFRLRKSPKQEAIDKLWRGVAEAKAKCYAAKHPERSRMELTENFLLVAGEIRDSGHSDYWSVETGIQFLNEYPIILAKLEADYQQIEQSNRDLIERIHAVLPGKEEGSNLLRPVEASE